MAKFITGNELNSEVERIFKNAEEKLILISPFIKLHHRFVDELKSKRENDKLQIIVIFGKNENNLSKSLTLSDVEFFKQFPNIEIRYEKRLHAKFYANEQSQILTSMNLYDYSQNENIEAGILVENNSFGQLLSTLNIPVEKSFDMQAGEYFIKVIKNSELLFKNIPEYESAMLGLTKKFKGIKNEVDKISELFAPTSKEKASRKSQEYGYCIRTGEKIPFNLEMPYSEKAFKSWSRWKNPDYKEKFCHKTGNESDGKTSMANPIL